MKITSTLFCFALSFICLSLKAQNPGGIAGTALWYRADMNTSSTTDGNSLTSWKDISSGNQVTQSTALYQPAYYNDAANNINYNPVIGFDGTDFLQFTSATGLPSGSSARTIFVVGTPSTTANANQNMIWFGNTSTRQAYAIGTSTSQGQVSFYNADITTASGFWQAGQPGMLSSTYAGGNNGAVNLYANGALQSESGTATLNTTLDYGLIGAGVTQTGNTVYATNPWNGNIAEIIIYPSALSAANRLQVMSYLSIRYGITLDQTTVSNYVSSSGTTIWDATALANYTNNVSGVGKDNNENLLQLQSRSQNAGFQLTLAMGNSLAATNSANTGSITKDKSYIVWGDNNASTAFTRAITSGPTVYTSMSRTWAFTKTGWTDQNITVAVDSSVVTYMLVASDAAFSHIVNVVAMSGGSATISSSKIPSGDFVTFAKIIPLPVSMVSFTGTATKLGNELSWITASEQNNAYFSIERSTDGRTFDSIGRVDGQGTTNLQNNYTFIDEHPVTGTTNYYRLRQVDDNGWFTNTNVVELQTAAEATVDNDYKAYPVPAHTTMHLTIPSGVDQLTLSIYTVSGGLAMRQELEQPGSGTDLDVSRLASGVYYLNIVQANGGKKTIPFIKQ